MEVKSMLLVLFFKRKFKGDKIISICIFFNFVKIYPTICYVSITIIVKTMGNWYNKSWSFGVVSMLTLKYN